jgi:pimeloyl-ACP methyl ester carboxylesterase
MRTGAPLAATLLLAGLLSSCSSPDPALVAELEALDTSFYLPDLRGSGLADLHVAGDLAVADVTAFVGTSLRQGVATIPYAEGSSVCEQFAWTYLADSDCRDNGEDAWIADFEEMTTVGLVREDGTLLVLGSLVTEADPALAEDALAALREAPRVSAEELAEEAGS